MEHFEFQYDLGKKMHIVVEFDVIKDSGNETVFKKIMMKPNYHDSFLNNLKPELQLVFDEKAQEYVFYQGYSFTNGDFRQIIQRMLKLAGK
jgi:hypothetical protein